MLETGDGRIVPRLFHHSTVSNFPPLAHSNLLRISCFEFRISGPPVKLEIRISKSETNPKLERHNVRSTAWADGVAANHEKAVSNLRLLNLRICFEFRVSSFGFPLPGVRGHFFLTAVSSTSVSPAATLAPVSPATLTGWRAKPFLEPPARTFAPSPTAQATSAVAPT